MANDFATFGNVQHNMFDADYLLCPNELTMRSLTEDYMIENLGNTTLLFGGYPRNTAFLEQERRLQIRRECGFEEMPERAFVLVANVYDCPHPNNVRTARDGGSATVSATDVPSGCTYGSCY